VRESGVTVLLTEHHMTLVMRISDVVTVLNYGEKIAEGPPDAVKRHPAVLEAYLGPSAAPPG
jgi:ABC-type branched-subunit amino acid transport system ATPase component